MRSCNLRNAGGDHQFALLITVMKAGTTSIRTTVASIRTVSRSPKPTCLTGEKPPATKAAKTTTISNAAWVITAPVLRSPSCTARSLSPVCR